MALWLDSSDQEPDQTVDEIVRRGLMEGRVGWPGALRSG